MVYTVMFNILYMYNLIIHLMRHANKHSTQTIIRQQQIFMKRFICISVGVFALSDIKNTVCITCFIQCYHKQIILDLDKLCACVCKLIIKLDNG